MEGTAIAFLAYVLGHSLDGLGFESRWGKLLFSDREERIPTRCNNIDDLLSIVGCVKVAARSSNLHSAHTLHRSITESQPATSNPTSKNPICSNT